jgi:8-hydroxy-5-deazaflavin:NADPH oxidoreductase
MQIGIIGSGHVGGTLTRRFTELGHEVTVANSRGPQSLTELAQETGAKPGTVDEAIAAGEVVVIAVPLAAVPDLPADAFRGKVVVDANNYYAQRDGEIEVISDKQLTSSRWTAELLTDAQVVKAFNNIEATHLLDLGRASGDPQRIALPVAGDDADAKQTVMELVDELGFDPVDAGNLDESWRQQPDTPVYGTDGDVESVRAGLSSAQP